MSKIVYGVSGEGSGHSSRAREMINHLQALGHVIKVVTYDRGIRNLSDDFDVFPTVGLHIASSQNKVSAIKTLGHNLQKLPAGFEKLKNLRAEIFDAWQPDCVITDFEPMTAYLANHYKLPCISLDNQHRMRFMKYASPPNMDKDRLVTKTIIQAMVPRPDVCLVTSFYEGEPKNDRTFIFPPIIRSEVLELQASKSDHIIVYLTNGFEHFLDMLTDYQREKFLVYGEHEEGQRGPLTFRPFSRAGFLEDLASAKAVMATAGFTLMTEALQLGKPYFALPMRGQFEQELNGFLLGRKNLGKSVRNPTHESIGDFFYHLTDYEERLTRYPRQGNTKIKEKLAELVADGAALAREFRKLRKNEVDDLSEQG